jgi:hypothetical protein
MYSLLVLGLVPGTNIQINFQTWLGLLLLTTVMGIAWYLYRLPHLEAMQQPLRQGLHATQLHRRGQ